MIGSYHRVLARPGAAAMAITGVVARLPISMMSLGIVVMVSTVTGSYGVAGAVSAAYMIGNAVVALPHGRLADRFGQTRVLIIDSIVFALATGLLVRSVTHEWGGAWPYVWAALAGIAIPQIGSMTRARWTSLLDDPDERHTAFALESIGDEICFVGGPSLVTFLSTVYAPQTGLLVALFFGTVGPLVLAAQRRTEPPYGSGTTSAQRGSMPWRRLGILTAGACALGSLFGAMEVATVASAVDAGHPIASGVMLSVLSVGSLIAGFLTGARSFSIGLMARARIGTAVLAAFFMAMPFVSSLWLLGALLFLAGFGIAPTLISVISYCEHIAPRARLTEAMGLLQSGLSAGIAPGAWGAGLMADHAGAASAFWVCVVSSLLAFGAATAAR